MDREKVIKSLHCRGQDLMIDLPACDGCNYQIQLVNRMGCDYRQICRDALALLKEQEAVEPYIAGNGESFETAETWWYECGNCNKPIDPNDKFCRHCGKPVKWE